jgi:hypothetical protein
VVSAIGAISDPTAERDTGDCGDASGHDASHQVDRRQQHFTILEQSNCLILEGRKGRIAADEANRKEEAPVGAD